MTTDADLTDGQPHIERARYTKAAKIAEFIEARFGSHSTPTNEAVRLAAQILAADGTIADRPQSDMTCEVVRAILATRDAMFTFADRTAHDVAAADQQRATTTTSHRPNTPAQDAEARSLLEGM